MTNNNRRQLARVRNAFLGATALAGFAAVATPASAIVINDSFTPTQVIDTTNVTGVGQMVVDQQNGFIGLCTATLINPRTVIFASHCVNENPSETAFEPATGYGAANGGLPIGFFFNANNNQAGNSAIGQWLNGIAGGPQYQTNIANNAYNSNFVVYNTNCCTLGLGGNFLQSDVAMAALDTPAIGIPTWTMLLSPLSGPAHATIEGYGDNGIGSTGQGSIDFKRRVAENIVSVLGSLDDQDNFLFGQGDGLPANLYMMDFNDPLFNTAQANVFDFDVFHDTATPKEGITAPGDSGGPLVIDHQFAMPTIAAVLSGGDRFFPNQPGASYGTTSFYQPLYLYWDWIVANNPYKYVGAKAGDGSWTDVNHWQMLLDPAMMTIDGSGNLVNALPTTAAQGETDIPPGFGEVCYFDTCVNLKTGVVTNPTPAPGPNPANGTRPFNGALGVPGFVALVESMTGLQDCGAAVVSVNALSTGNFTAQQQACVAGQAAGGVSPALAASAQSDWLNPEGTAHVGDAVDGEDVQGAPGASPGQVINNNDADPTTARPARYYDVTLSEDGTTTLSGADITVDKLTINGANAALAIAADGSLTTNITTNVFAGVLQVDGTLTSPNGVAMFGGLLEGNGTVNGPVSFLIGAVTAGTNGTIGALTVNGPFALGVGSTQIVDFNNTSSDVIHVNGPALLGGTLVAQTQTAPRFGDTHVLLTATGGITGSYDAVVAPFSGILFPILSQQTVAGVDEEVLTIGAQSFTSLLGGAGGADEKTIAAALDTDRANNFNNLHAIFDLIDNVPANQIGQALANFETLAPDAERAAPLVGDMVTTGFDNMVWQHLAESGAATPETQMAGGMRINSEGLRMALASASGTSNTSQQMVGLGMGIATNPGGGNDAIPTGAPASPDPASDSWMFLPNGAGGFLSGSSLDGSVEIGGAGGRADVRGLIVGGGLDFPMEDGFTLGATFGYSDATATLRAMPSTLQSESIQGALYARYDFGDHWIAEGFGAYGHQTIETRRVAILGLTPFLISGHTGGDTPSAGAYIGRSFDIATLSGSTLNLVPSLSLQYTSAEIDPFTETGGAPALTFAGYSENALMSRLGMDAKITFDLFGAVHVTPNAHAFWVDSFDGNNGSIQSVFAAGPSAIMTFDIAQRDRSYGELGVGVDLDLSDFLGTDAVLSGRYDGNTRDDVQYGAWTGRLSIKF